MTSLKFISNTKEKLADNLNKAFGWADEIDIAVAYLKTTGYNSIKSLLDQKNVRILVGFDFWLTDAFPLKDILNKAYPCKVYRTPMTTEERSYHPKIYIARRGNEIRAIVGSSNLTWGGLYSNIEGNILICGLKEEPEISEIMDFFEKKWRSSLAQYINANLISEYSILKQQYEVHTDPIYAKPSFAFRKERISSKGNAVIACMTEAHDRGDIYDRLIGIPIGANKVAVDNIIEGTRVFIYYKGIGISKVVEALDVPYIDNTVVDEWKDGLPETYSVRVRTKLLRNYVSSIKLGRLQQLGIRRADTGTLLVGYHLQSSLTPISDNDGDSIEYELSKK